MAQPRWSLILAATALALVTSFLVVLFRAPSWSFCPILCAALMLGTIPSLIRGDMSSKLATFFALLAICDFVKRLTFLTPDQAMWSQYVSFLFPYAYYYVCILLPFLLSRRLCLKSGFDLVSLLYIMVAMISTWLAVDFPFLSKLTASALLIVPWTMLLIAKTYKDSLSRVAQVLFAWGLLSAFYGLAQLAFGPTIVEVRWAAAVGDFSIGAGRLASFLEGNPITTDMWRVNGFQADALTFGLFMITALVSCCVLRYERRIGPALTWSASVVLILAMASCLVRTVWISCVATVAFGFMAHRLRVILRPWVFVLVLAGLFVTSDFSSAYLRDQAGAVAIVDNPYINRVMLLGTVAARKYALQHLGEIAPQRLLFGSGYAASSWVGGKFGEDDDRLKESLALMSHNVILELFWYVGLPGVVLFMLLFCEVSRCAFVAISRAGPCRRKTLAVMVGYIVGMFVSGLGNGGVFLGFYFFYFCGVVVGHGTAAGRLRQGQFAPNVAWSSVLAGQFGPPMPERGHLQTVAARAQSRANTGRTPR